MARRPYNTCYRKKEARERTIQMLNIYAQVVEDLLAIPVLKGERKHQAKNLQEQKIHIQ